MKRATRWAGVALLYGLMLAGVVWGMLSLRRAALATYGTSQAQAAWDAWRQAAREMSHAAGPVRRREPKSVQPPALVLMRDHFGVCLGGALLLSSVLFGTIAWLAAGALTRGGGVAGGAAPRSPRRLDASRTRSRAREGGPS